MVRLSKIIYTVTQQRVAAQPLPISDISEDTPWRFCTDSAHSLNSLRIFSPPPSVLPRLQKVSRKGPGAGSSTSGPTSVQIENNKRSENKIEKKRQAPLCPYGIFKVDWRTSNRWPR